MLRHRVAVGAGELRRPADAPTVVEAFAAAVDALQFTSKRNSPRPATKNGRRSSKNDSYAERLSTAGSDSTWPKSGLIVASSVRFDATRYFRSPPTVTLDGFVYRLFVIVDALFVTTYGIASSRRGASRSSSPVERAELRDDVRLRLAEQRPAHALVVSIDVAIDREAEDVPASLPVAHLRERNAELGGPAERVDPSSRRPRRRPTRRPRCRRSRSARRSSRRRR